jgi:hypothetical protein
MCDATGLSQRRACRLTGLSLSTYLSGFRRHTAIVADGVDLSTIYTTFMDSYGDPIINATVTGYKYTDSNGSHMWGVLTNYGAVVTRIP